MTIKYLIRIFFEIFNSVRSQKISTKSSLSLVTQLSQSVRQTKEVRSAMGKFRKHYVKHCEWCGNTDSLEIHHIFPVWHSPHLAAKFDNFIPLCRKCHLIVGHARSFKNKFIVNIKELCANRNLIDRRTLYIEKELT